MGAKKILLKGPVDRALKKDFLREWRQFNKVETRKGRKAISQGKFLEILLMEGVKDGKAAPAAKPRSVKSAASRRAGSTPRPPQG